LELLKYLVLLLRYENIYAEPLESVAKCTVRKNSKPNFERFFVLISSKSMSYEDSTIKRIKKLFTSLTKKVQNDLSVFRPS
jgi:hypothetical protein